MTVIIKHTDEDIVFLTDSPSLPKRQLTTSTSAASVAYVGMKMDIFSVNPWHLTQESNIMIRNLQRHTAGGARSNRARK